MRKITIAAALTTAATFIATPAFAHVTVSPKEANKGGYATLTFKVPNEEDNASTTKVEVDVPKDAGITSAMSDGSSAWQTSVEKSPQDNKQVVTKITFSAVGTNAIAPGQFREFKVSMGPLPKDKDAVTFGALQTYSNGDVVRWTDVQSGDKEPEHPAPKLTLSGTSSDSHGGHSVGTDTNAAKTAESSDKGNDFLSGLAVGISAIALLVSLFAISRTRRRV